MRAAGVRWLPFLWLVVVAAVLRHSLPQVRLVAAGRGARVLLGGPVGGRLAALLPAGVELAGPRAAADAVHLILEYAAVRACDAGREWTVARRRSRVTAPTPTPPPPARERSLPA